MTSSEPSQIMLVTSVCAEKLATVHPRCTVINIHKRILLVQMKHSVFMYDLARHFVSATLAKDIS